jgi:hypothetical protein
MTWGRRLAIQPDAEHYRTVSGSSGDSKCVVQEFSYDFKAFSIFVFIFNAENLLLNSGAVCRSRMGYNSVDGVPGVFTPVQFPSGCVATNRLVKVCI